MTATTTTTDFQGPYAGGPPARALEIDAPALDRLGLAELGRALETALIFVLALVPAAILAVVRRSTDWARVLSEATVDAFMTLGPTFVKLGQMIASSPGVFPKPLADACLRCLDDVPPIPPAMARQVVTEDLGRPADTIFTKFDAEPLSAASIAQVHACVLPDGREAVLKIQRPHIRDRMNRDLRIMYLIVRLIDRFVEKAQAANLPAIIEDLHQVTNEELNFALEAHRQTAFRENIGAFGDNEHITAPEVYWDYCGPRVIAMERMRGVPMDDFDELRRRGIDGELILRRGIKVWMEAALVHGPFHGDVHAGNLWVLDDGRSTYLDFGIMGVLPDSYREAVKDAQYTAMIDGDYTRIVKAWQNLGILPDDLGPIDVVAESIKMVVEPMLDLTIGQVSLGELMQQQLKLAEQYGAKGQREFVLVTKQLMYFERYAKELAPDYNMSRDVYLLKNVFPDDVARVAEERGITFPD